MMFSLFSGVCCFFFCITPVLILLLSFFLVSLSDVLALPIFKQEDTNLPPENETKNPPFQYVLCAATSPAVKLHDETLTYLNQGERHIACTVEKVLVVRVKLHIMTLVFDILLPCFVAHFLPPQ